MNSESPWHLFDDTRKILTSDSKDLFELASVTSFDPLTFYHGCDLSGSDLSGQDLRGLNFSRADLRRTNLSNISYDYGAFNDSILNSDQSLLRDEFDSSVEMINIVINNTRFIYYFVQFRPGYLDSYFDVFGTTYTDFAKRAGVSTGTLWKARHGSVVAKETALGIANTIKEGVENWLPLRMDNHEKQIKRLILSFLQPCARFVEQFGGGHFRVIPREYLHDYHRTFFTYVD
jgi:hypothetical protein